MEIRPLPVDSSHKGTVICSFYVSFVVNRNKLIKNSQVVGDLRRHDVHVALL